MQLCEEITHRQLLNSKLSHKYAWIPEADIGIASEFWHAAFLHEYLEALHFSDW